MSDKIVRGYWSCPYCNKTDIDGLIDECPGCGRRKPENIRYYMKGVTPGKKYSKSMVSANDVLNDDELEKANISRAECDGNHKDWVCNYCNSLNNWSDGTCRSCGSPKSEADKEYGMNPIQSKQNANIREENINNNKEDDMQTTYPNSSFFTKYRDNIILSCIIAFFVILFTALFFPYNKTVTVTGFSWERNIYLEEYKTVKESDWSVPTGGRIYDSKREIRSYKQVLDHYETKTRQVSERVLDHYETEYSYSDNGNGTFTEHTSQRPVYRTEYHTETYQDPVYRSEPVYDTKYYYEIERWINTEKEYPSSGKDHNPYWNEAYLPLKENFRDTNRYSKYEVFYDNDTEEEKTYDEWAEMNIGDELIQKRCLLGIVYGNEYKTK